MKRALAAAMLTTGLAACGSVHATAPPPATSRAIISGEAAGCLQQGTWTHTGPGMDKVVTCAGNAVPRKNEHAARDCALAGLLPVQGYTVARADLEYCLRRYS